MSKQVNVRFDDATHEKLKTVSEFLAVDQSTLIKESTRAVLDYILANGKITFPITVVETPSAPIFPKKD